VRQAVARAVACKRLDVLPADIITYRPKERESVGRSKTMRLAQKLRFVDRSHQKRRLVPQLPRTQCRSLRHQPRTCPIESGPITIKRMQHIAKHLCFETQMPPLEVPAIRPGYGQQRVGAPARTGGPEEQRLAMLKRSPGIGRQHVEAGRKRLRSASEHQQGEASLRRAVREVAHEFIVSPRRQRCPGVLPAELRVPCAGFIEPPLRKQRVVACPPAIRVVAQDFVEPSQPDQGASALVALIRIVVEHGMVFR